MFIPLVWVYYDCIGCWCPHWPLMTVMQQPEPERELQPAERRPGSGHLDTGTLGGERWDVTSSLIIHYGADTRRRHIHTISSGGLIIVIMSPKTESDNQEEKEELTEAEMEFVTTVFKSFETGLREATIYPKVNLTFQ